MNECWFVLKQTYFSPPSYEKLSKAGGKAEGPLRLGDVVPSPKDLYPILTQGPLPVFSPAMRISTTKLCEFSWKTSTTKDNEALIEAGAPIATEVDSVVKTKLKSAFMSTMENWAEFKTMEHEIVQPSKLYIDGVLAIEDVNDCINQQKWPLLNQWTVYVVTGLMIARAGGKIGSSTSGSAGLSGNLNVDISSIATTNLDASRANKTETSNSAEIQGDRIWAVRFAKVHKGLLRSRWIQTEVTVGAALDGSEEEKEKVGDVLKNEGISDFGIVETTTEGQNFVFVTGVSTGRSDVNDVKPGDQSIPPGL